MGRWNADLQTGQMSETQNAGSVDAADSPMWGDGPADIFGDAVDKITDEFRSELGRSPTKGELRAGLEFTLGPLNIWPTSADSGEA